MEAANVFSSTESEDTCVCLYVRFVKTRVPLFPIELIATTPYRYNMLWFIGISF